jgi:D-threo-aldose 1-dehydrogenase
LLDEIELDVILLAGRYTLLEQGALGLLDRCAAMGVRVIVGGPFNSGLLVETAPAEDLHYDYGAAPQALVDKAKALRRTCEAHRAPLPAAALRFPLAHPAVACVLPGLSDPGQVGQALDWRAREILATLWPALRKAGLIVADAPLPH